MLHGKKGPIILLSILTIFLFFILGMQYGKKVESTNKSVSYTLSLTPAQKPSQALITPISYSEFKNEQCALSFLYPATMTIEKQSSTEALLKYNSQSIAVTCSKEIPVDTKKASGEALLDSKKSLTFSSGNIIEYRVRNNINKLIIISVTKELSPLIEETISFTN